jgi:hypothetical protein
MANSPDTYPSLPVKAGAIDPRVYTFLAKGRALSVEPLLVPSWLRPETVRFIPAGGKCLGQPAGVGAPLSTVHELLKTMRR